MISWVPGYGGVTWLQSLKAWSSAGHCLMALYIQWIEALTVYLKLFSQQCLSAWWTAINGRHRASLQSRGCAHKSSVTFLLLWACLLLGSPLCILWMHHFTPFVTSDRNSGCKTSSRKRCYPGYCRDYTNRQPGSWPDAQTVICGYPWSWSRLAC